MGKFIVSGGTIFGVNGSGNASNGNSVSSGSGDIVMGNDTGDPLMPGAWISDREIVNFSAFHLDVVDFFTPSTRLRITDQRVILTNLITGSDIFMELNGDSPQWQANAATPGQDTNFSISNPTSGVSGQSNGVNPFFELFNPTGNFHAELRAAVLRIRSNSAIGNGLNIDAANNDVGSTGTFSSADPGSGSGKVKFGKIIAAAVVLEPTHYWETEIDGVVVKIGIVI